MYNSFGCTCWLFMLEVYGEAKDVTSIKKKKARWNHFWQEDYAVISAVIW